MTERQILLVKNSWSYVIVNADEAGQLFYNRLFEVAPEVKPMFKGDIKEQSRKLMNMVTYIVTKLQKLDEIMGEVRSLAQRHGKYGVKPHYYQIVGSTLLWTLKEGLGDKWNTETEQAWTTVYSALADAMIKTQLESKAA
jgi:nitric oxide dioxygenase